MLLGFVTGATPRPSPTMVVQTGDRVAEVSNPKFMRWMHADQLVMAWLVGSLSESALKSVYGLRSSSEVWFSLAKRYDRVSTTRKLDLQKKVYVIDKLGKSMAVYLAEIKSLCDQLDSIGSPLSEHEKISRVLTGLGREYESICTVIEESMETYPGPCFDDVVFKLTNFEDKIKAYEAATAVTLHQTFYTNKNENSHSYSSNNNGSYSNRGGHSRGGRSNRGRAQSRGSHSRGGRGYSTQGREEYYNNDFAQALAAMRLSDQEYSAGQEWISDTGATAHITNSTVALQNAQLYAGTDSVIVGNGEFLPITHVGSTILQGSADKTAPHDRKEGQ
ncbi:PREDICTED: uncharacterized protein LOC109131236 [Camelina sativa]|uniref:Uncharacterized protein LOC109131236 n=1 Tax=Camelina sativa TaxID=90675 RepID=A0ABM1REN7_CAMSA|nr:PREDICTED: uncharacterized protein LOC109131236 [Camelina sativa]